jgi:hypothetical protein
MTTQECQKRAKRRRQEERRRKEVQRKLMVLAQSLSAMPGSWLERMCKQYGIDPFTGKLLKP